MFVDIPRYFDECVSAQINAEGRPLSYIAGQLRR